MAKSLASAQELATVMPDRWHTRAGPRVLNLAGGAAAAIINGVPAEVSSPPGDADIVSYVLKGEARHRLWHDNQLIHDGPVRNGTTNIVPSGVIPRAVLSEKVDVLHVYLPHAELASAASQIGWSGSAGALEIINPMFERDARLEGLLEAISESLTASHPLDRLWLDSLVTSLQARIIQRWSNLSVPRTRGNRGGLAPFQLRRVTDYISDKLTDELSLAELAALVDLSPHHFCRAFKESTGLPPHRWQIQARINRAQALMLGTSDPLAEIAVASGFSDQSHFTTAFRKAIGQTPHAWRRDRRS